MYALPALAQVLRARVAVISARLGVHFRLVVDAATRVGVTSIFGTLVRVIAIYLVKPLAASHIAKVHLRTRVLIVTQHAIEGWVHTAKRQVTDVIGADVFIIAC